MAETNSTTKATSNNNSTGNASAKEMNVAYFRDLLDSETDKLQKLCDKWSKVLEYKKEYFEQVGPEGAKMEEEEEERIGAIRSSIGKAKLLVSQRFKQFASLIDDCEFSRSQLPTRLEDLLGFWEMIDCQIKDVHTSFNSLASQATS